MNKYAAKSAQTLGMRTYFGRSPFFLLVDKEFPKNDAFTLLQTSKPVTICGKVVKEKAGGADVREVSVALGEDFSVSVDYSSVPNINATEVRIALKSYAITDLNADGFPDMKLSFSPVRCLEVWYGGRWMEVQRADSDGGSRRKRLLDGTPLVFDDSRGMWIHPTP